MSTRNDRDLDDLLSDNAGRIGASYRKLGKLEPPRRLDRNVLAEASRAVHGRPRSSVWLLGVGTAAGVLLAAGIAWRVNHDMAEQRETVPASSPAAETVPPRIIRVEPRDSSNDNGKVSDKLEPADQRLGLDDADAEIAGRVTKPERANPVERKAAQAKQKLDSAFAPDPAIKKAAPKPAQVAADKQEEIREQAAPMEPQVSAQPAAAAPMNTPAPDESRTVQSMRDSAESEAPQAFEPMQKATGESRTAAESSNNSVRADARRERSSFSGSGALNAEIDRIRALLRSGQREEAIEALRELRRQHPDLVLPADLQAIDG